MFTFDDVQAAYMCGREVGRQERFDQEIEFEIQRRIHARYLGAVAEVREMATRNHGPAWASLLLDALDAPWSAA